MLWLIPHLFADPRLLDAALPGLHLPGLATLFTRGRATLETPTGTEAALARACGIVRQHDWPVAALTRLADGGGPDESYWMRADPAHFAVMRDRVVVSSATFDDLTADEATRLTASLAAHFGEDFAPLALHPQRWYLRFAQPPQLVTTPPSLARGRALDRILPTGDGAPRWRAQLNEAQMLLHAHPVNQAREARGALPVNGLWLWGGGIPGPATPAGLPVLAAEGAAAHLAQAFGCARQALPAAWQPQNTEVSGVAILNALETAAVHHDALGWREALRELETGWFAPLARARGQLGVAGVSLLDPIAGRGVRVQRRDAWMFWRRPASLASLLSPIQPGNRNSHAA